MRFGARHSAKPEIARDGKNDDNHYRAEGIGEPAFAMAVPMTGKRGDIGWLDARDIAIVAPAFVASSDQRRGQLLLDQLLNEIPDPIPRLRRLQISATSATPPNRILECGRPKSVHFA
jgi:hypothetical protein